MSRALDWVQAILGKLLALIADPLDLVSPVLALTVVSIITGVLLLILFGSLSAQKRIAAVKKRIYGCILEAVLFRQDPAVSIAAQGRMAANGLWYLLLAVPPILVLAIPCVLVMSQLNARYGFDSVKAGTPVVIRAKLSSPDVVPQLAIVSGVSELIGPLRSPIDSEFLWRLTPQKDATIALSIGDRILAEKQIPVVGGRRSAALYPLESDSFVDRLLYPLQPGSVVGKSELSELEINLPTAELNFLGTKVHWIILFLIISILAGVVGSKMFGVEI